MIKHTSRAARRALSAGLRCFSDISGGELMEEGTAAAHLTEQASLYVHVSRLWSI